MRNLKSHELAELAGPLLEQGESRIAGDLQVSVLGRFSDWYSSELLLKTNHSASDLCGMRIVHWNSSKGHVVCPGHGWSWRFRVKIENCIRKQGETESDDMLSLCPQNF